MTLATQVEARSFNPVPISLEMFEFKILEESELTDEIIHQMLRMKCLEWPDRYHDANYNQHWDEFPGKRGHCAGRSFVLAYEGDRLVAQAESFPRTIRSETEALEVLALAGVLAHPNYRGRGLGRRVIEPVFQRVDAGEFLFCLFQTPIPEFYAHLKCVLVEDTFYNGHVTDRREETIWWEDSVMVYPGNRTWIEGEIDLNGPAF